MSPTQHFWRDPALPFLEGRRARGSLSCYAPHTHPSFSIGIVDAGRSVFALADRSLAIAPGDVVVVQADDVHSCNPQDLSSWSYRMFHLDHAWLHRLLAGSPVTRGMLPSIPSQVLRHPRAVVLMDRITAVLDDAAGGKEARIAACLIELLLRCARIGVQETATATLHAQRKAGLDSAHAYLQEHCRESIALDTLADVAGLDRYQLIRQFRRRYGLTPHALLLDMKINQARSLLRQGSSLSDAAYATGFADQSHFHRSFKSRVAVTPLQYSKI